MPDEPICFAMFISCKKGKERRPIMQNELEHDVPVASHNNLVMVKDEVLSTGKEQFPGYIGLPSRTNLSLLYLCWRTMMDVTFILCGLLVMLLILPILALLIYLDSPGPIFYHQERVGYRGRKFSMHKFRSMRADAELAG